MEVFLKMIDIEGDSSHFYLLVEKKDDKRTQPYSHAQVLWHIGEKRMKESKERRKPL